MCICLFDRARTHGEAHRDCSPSSSHPRFLTRVHADTVTRARAHTHIHARTDTRTHPHAHAHAHTHTHRHACLPNIYESMREPQYYDRMLDYTWVILGFAYMVMAAVGYLMFGDLTQDEVCVSVCVCVCAFFVIPDPDTTLLSEAMPREVHVTVLGRVLLSNCGLVIVSMRELRHAHTHGDEGRKKRSG